MSSSKFKVKKAMQAGEDAEGKLTDKPRLKMVPSSQSQLKKSTTATARQEQCEQQLHDSFLGLCRTWQQISQISGAQSKASKTELMAGLFRRILKEQPEILVPAYYLCIMKVGPQYCSSELGVGKQTISKLAMKVCAMGDKQFYNALKEEGDLGSLVMKRKGSQKGIEGFLLVKKSRQPLTIPKVFATFEKVSKTSGKSSAGEKEGQLLNLLFAASPLEAKFIFRWLEGNLKVMFAQKSMQQALSKALCQTFLGRSPEIFAEYDSQLKRVLSEYPDYGAVIGALLEAKQDYQHLSRVCKLTPGIPCKPMLAKPTKGFGQVIARFEGKEFTCEYKYDGLRGQIHFSSGSPVKIYSRNLEDMTAAYPDISLEVERIAGLESISQAIIDCEIVAVNPTSGQLLSFQTLSTRGRKNVDISQIGVSICMFVFDLLYLDIPLTDRPLHERQQILRQRLGKHRSSKLQIAQAHICKDVELMDEFLTQSVRKGAQGLMVKDLNSRYCPSKRSFEWVKLKKDYISGLGDTIDCVPVGAWHGTGKRSGVYGSYLLAVYNQEMEMFETLCRIGTGFSDEVLEAAHKFFQDKLVDKRPANVSHEQGDHVDQWLEPCCVWEIKGADLQKSPIYTCGKGGAGERGIGLRFPRLLRVREDKRPEQASSSESVLQMYGGQAVVMNMKEAEEEDDFY